MTEAVSKEAREAYQAYLNWFTAKPNTDGYGGLEQAMQTLINSTLDRAAAYCASQAKCCEEMSNETNHPELRGFRNGSASALSSAAAKILALKETGHE